MEALQFIQINPKEFQLEIIKGVIEALGNPKEGEILLTQQEVADFYKVSKATVIKWQREGKIKAYSISNERRYKKSELLAALTEMK